MKIDKNELSRKITQIKGIVPKTTTIEALQGVLLKDGYLIASNTEVTVKAKLESAEGTPFIIPAKVFDLIGSLPSGELTMECKDDTVSLQVGKIKNKFKTHLAEQFTYDRQSFSGKNVAAIPAATLLKAISHVNYAIPAVGSNPIMTGMFFECTSGRLNLVGLDGHRIAWDSVELDAEFQFIVPKSAVEKMLQLDLQGDIRISCDKHGALFETDDYEIYTRLIEGTYFPYAKMFNYGDISMEVEKRSLLEAINRAKLCGTVEDKAPVLLDVTGTAIQITYRNSLTDYHEEVQTLSDAGEGLRIAFNPRLLLDSLKAFECENVLLSFATAKTPAIIKAEDSDMTALILPVNSKEV